MTVGRTPRQEIAPPPQRWSEYITEEVNDLAWVLYNSSLLAEGAGQTVKSSSVCHIQNFSFTDNKVSTDKWLRQIDTALPNNLPKRIDFTRLGLYFEALILFILSSSEEFNGTHRIVDHHLPVRNESKTLGEIDFIVENRHREKIHVEATVKFFLQLTNDQGFFWLGPNANDSFDKKYWRTFEHQLPLSNSSEFLCRYPQHAAIKSHCYLFTGELFHHWSERAATPPNGNELCARGHWLYAYEFLELLELNQYHWQMLPKLHWLAGNSAAVRNERMLIQTLQQLEQTLGDAVNKLQTRAFCFERFTNTKTLAFMGRLMVVPNYWPTTKAPSRSR